MQSPGIAIGQTGQDKVFITPKLRCLVHFKAVHFRVVCHRDHIPDLFLVVMFGMQPRGGVMVFADHLSK